MTAPSEKKTWKSRLLSSSLPLEYEVSQTLASNDFSVRSDYPFSTLSVAERGSVDLLGWLPLKSDTKEKDPLEIFILVECKYRNPSSGMLFFPQTVRTGRKPRSPSVFNVEDRFSLEHVGKNVLHELNGSFPLAMKATEIAFHDGTVSDSELRSGLEQLYFGRNALYCDLVNQALNVDHGFDWGFERAMLKSEAAGIFDRAISKVGKSPGFLERRIAASLESMKDGKATKRRQAALVAWLTLAAYKDWYLSPMRKVEHRLLRPFFYSSVLVTNTKLWLARENTSIETIKTMSSIEDVADPVDYVALSFSGDPRVSRLMEAQLKTSGPGPKAILDELENRWSRNFNGGWRANVALPALRSGSTGRLGHALVCTQSAFDAFLKRTVEAAKLMSSECRPV